MYNLIMKSLSLLFICLIIYFKFFIVALFASQEVSDDDGFEVSGSDLNESERTNHLKKITKRFHLLL